MLVTLAGIALVVAGLVPTDPGLVAAGSALVALLHGYGAMAEHARRSCAPVAASE
jgi:hypothetical protein